MPASSPNLFGETVMTVRFTAEMFCNQCGDWFTCFICEFPQKKRAVAMAKKKGWKRKRGKHGWMVDICPECQKEEKENV